MPFNDSLRRLRTDRKLTQKDVFTAINKSESLYQRYERGAVTPSLDVLLMLADYFDVSLDELVGRHCEKK